MTENNGNLVSFEEAFSGSLKEYQPQWFTAPHGVRLKIAPLDNPKYLAKLRELLRPHASVLRRSLKAYRKDSDESNELFAVLELERETQYKAVAECVLYDWENLASEEDRKTPLKYTPEIGYQYFKRYPKFFELVTTIARDEESFQKELLKEEVENS